MYRGTRRNARGVEIPITLKISSVQQRNFNASLVISMNTPQVSVIKKKQALFKQRKPKAHILQVGDVYACDQSICRHLEDGSSSHESFYLQVKIQQSQPESKKIPAPSHLITNIDYRLKSCQTRKPVPQSKIRHLHI